MTIVLFIIAIILASAAVYISVLNLRDMDETIAALDRLSPEQRKEVYEAWKSQGFIR